MSRNPQNSGGPSELGEPFREGLEDLPLAPNPGSRSDAPAGAAATEPAREAGAGRPGRRGWWLALLFLLVPAALAVGYLLRPAPAVGVLSAALADFGELPLEAEPKLFDLEVGNQGEEPMRVAAAELAGEGAEAFYVAEDRCSGRTVRRGESCRLSLAFAPAVRGRHRASLAVATSAPNSPLRLPLEGTVLAAELTRQLEEIEFESLPPGTSGEPRSFWVGNGGTAELRLGQLRFEGEAAADFFPAEDSCSARTLAPAGRCRVALYFVPGAVGERRASLVIGSDAPEGDLRVRLRGVGLDELPSLAASTEALAFPATPVGAASEPLAVELANEGSGPLTIEAFRLGAGRASPFEISEETCTRAPLAPTETCRVALVFRPRAEQSAAGRLEVEHSAADEPWVLPLEGAGALAHAAVDAERRSFGEVALGSSSRGESIRLENVGGAPLEVGEIGVYGMDAAAFTVAEDTCSGRLVPASEACRITLAFSPGRDGPHRAELLVSHAADSGRERVELTGSGVSPRLEAVPSRLGFGEASVGSSQGLDLNLANRGRAPARVERIRLAGANRSDLRIEADECSRLRLRPGAACKIRLVFSPSAPGPRRAELEVTHDGSPTLLRVPISGIGRL